MKFDEAVFDFAVHRLANKPAFLWCAVVVEADTRAAFIGGDDRIPEGTCRESVEVATENGLEIQPVAALK